MASVERRGPSPRPQVHYLLGNQLCSGDLVYRKGRPVLVISWRTVGWRRVPYVSFPLDAKRLKPSTQPNVYVYEGELKIAVESVKPTPQD
jgi:hypothetical protein